MAEVSEAQSTPAPVNVIGTDAVSHSSVIRDSSAATTNAHASPTTLPPASTLIPSPSTVSSSTTTPHSALPSAASHKNASASSGNVGVISPLVVSSDQAVSSLDMQSSQVGMSAESSSIYNSSIISRLASELLQNHSASTTQAHVSGQNDAPLPSSDSGTGSGSASSGKGKKSGGRKLDALMASQSSPLTIPSELSSLADPTGLESDLPGGTPHKLLQAVRSTTLPFPLPVPTYSQAVQAARASGNVSSERATIIRETVKFFLTLKYWWTTEDYDRIAELVVNEFPELRDPVAFPSAPCYGKVRLDLSMCARNIRRITKNQEKRKGSPAQNNKEPVAEAVKTEPVVKPPKSGGKSRRKSSAGPSISVPTMVALSSAAQMLPHTAHTAALHSSASLQSLQDPKEVSSIPYLLTSTPPVPSTPSSSTTASSTVLPPVAHFLGHPSGHSHGTGGIVFPSLLPITSTTPTTTPVPSTTTTSQVTMESVRTSVDSGHEAFMDSALSLANAWRPDATLPDPLPVPPYSEKRRVRTDLSQTARNIRRREVMLKRRDSRSPEARFTAVGTVSLPPPSNPQISSDFCNELLAAASIIESRTAALHQRDVAKALELHAEVSRDPETAPSVITHTKGSEGLRPDSGKDGEESVSVSKESLPESAKYLYNYAAGDGLTGSVDNGVGLVNSQLAVIKQEAGEVGEVGGEVDHYQQQMLQAQASQAWLSAQAMSQALSMQALTSLTGLTAQALSAAHLSDHLLSSHTPTTTLSPAPPAAHQSTGSAASNERSLSSASSPVSTQPLVQPSSYALSVPTSTSPIPLSDTSLSDASPVDRMSAMAMWRSTCLPDPLPVPPYSLNVLRARDTGNTASARPRIIRETTQFFLALKMWWTTQDYERIAELVLRQFPQLKTQNIKKDLGTCARNMRRRLPLSKTKQWAGYQSPNQSGLKDGEGMGDAGVTLGELATMASLREAQDKGRGDASLGSLADDPRHSLLAQSVYEQNAWNVFYQQQFSTPETSQVVPPARGNKRSLSDSTGSKAYELGEKELAEALKQAVAQSVKQLGEVDSGVRRHSVDVSEPSKNRDVKHDLAAKNVINPVTPEPSKSDNYPVMKELISHPAISVRDPKLTTESPVFPGTRTAHSGSVSEGGVGHKHPTPARAHSQPACPLRSEVPRIESQEAPMNLTCGSSSEPSKPAPKPKAVKSESKASKKGGSAVDAFTAREQVWFPHGSPWKKSGQTIIKALPTPLPIPKYSQKLMKAREEGLSYRHRSEIIRETARFYLGFKYWWSSADYSRISELVIAEFPDLKDPVSQPGQPFYRRVQRDLSMCARNLRRKNTRQQVPSSDESPPVTTPKKAKSASKEKKPKKVLNIKTEVGEQGLAGTDSVVGSSSLGEAGSVLGSVMNVPTPALSLPMVTSAASSSSITQAILQSGVDPSLSSLPPMSSLQSTSQQSSLSVLSQPLSASSASVLPQFASAITSVPYSLPESLSGVYSTAQTTPTSSSLAHSAYAATLSIPLAVSSTSSAPYADSLNKTLWAAGGVGFLNSEPQVPSKTSKKRTSSQASTSKASSTKPQGTAKPKSSSAQSKAVKSVAPSTHTSTVVPLKSEQSSTEARAQVKNGGSAAKGKSPSSSGAATSASSGSKKSKDTARNLASRSGYGDGRALSNTTAIVTPTLSEAHASASSSSSANGGVSDKVYINPEHGSELRSQLTKLWQDGKFFDASLEVDNYRLPAHKLVLLAASPYLQSTFRHANPTSHLEVNLPRDTGVDAARDFLKYVYQGVLHVAPTTVHALRRIAAMLQIDQLLTYCDDYLLQLSSISSSSSSSSEAALQRRVSLPHASSQVRRVSVNLRDPSHGQVATTEHNTTTLASLTLPSSHIPVGTAHYVPSHAASARKRTSASLEVPPYGTEERKVNQTDRQQELNLDLNRHLLPASLQQSELDAQYGAHRPHDTHITYPHHETHQVAHTLAKRFCPSDDNASVDERTSLDSQAGVSYQSVVNNPAYLEGSHADGVQSIAGQHVTERGRGSTSVIHRGPNLMNAPSHSMNQDTSTAPSVLTTTTSTMDDRSNVTDTEAMVQYYAESAEAGEGVPGEEGVVVRLLPQAPVHMEVGDAMQLQSAANTIQLDGEHAIQLDAEHTIQFDGEHAIQLSGDYQLSGHTLSEQSIQLPEGHTIQLSRQLAQHLSQHGIPLSQHLAQQISLEGPDEAIQQLEEGREGGQTEEGQGTQDQGVEGMEEGEKVVIEVIQEEGQEVMVEEVIVESGDLLQDVDVAACETVECSLLPQTYCSSPETTQPLTCQVEESGGQGEEGGEQAYQNLASQWVKQQYAHTPLDADTARQFVAALQERMYGQTSSSSSIQPPPTYQETVYVQSGMDGETVYVSGPAEPETVYVGGATEGEELVVETSVNDSGGQAATVDGDVDDGDGHASLLPQTYRSSPPRPQSPSVGS